MIRVDTVEEETNGTLVWMKERMSRMINTGYVEPVDSDEEYETDNSHSMRWWGKPSHAVEAMLVVDVVRQQLIPMSQHS
jgi:hypothetical protein